MAAASLSASLSALPSVPRCVANDACLLPGTHRLPSFSGLKLVASKKFEKIPKSFSCGSRGSLCAQLVSLRASLQLHEREPRNGSTEKESDVTGEHVPTSKAEDGTSTSMKFALSLASSVALTSILLLTPSESLAANTGGRVGGSTFKSSPKTYSKSSTVLKSKTNIYVSPQLRTAPPVYGSTAPYFGGLGLPFFPIPQPYVVPVPVPVPVVPSAPLVVAPAPSVAIVTDGFPLVSLFVVFGGLFGVLKLVSFFRRNGF